MKLVHQHLQKAIYDLIKNDTEIISLARGVYDNPPEEATFPYIAFGPMLCHDWSTKTSRGFQSVIALHVYSRSGKEEVLAILDRLFELLQSGTLSITDFYLVAMRFEYHDIALEDEGRTYHGMIRFRAFSEFAAAS